MNEELLSYIWKHQLFRKENLCTTDAEVLHVFQTGQLNHDAGPDFFNAQIQVGQIRLAGNIELHVKSSDYLKHKHQNDPAYSSIILHVVFEKDIELALDCPELELKPFINEQLLSRFDYLRQAQGDIPCSHLLMPEHDQWPLWLERLFIERIETKGEALEEILKYNAHHWERSFYQILSRAFGFNVNVLPFEIVGRILDPSLLHRYAGNELKIEALLFGLAGFLESKAEDGYQLGLKQEYQRLKHIHNLETIDVSMWKFHRLRPSNFPCIRLSQLAQLLIASPQLLDSIIQAQNLDELKGLFTIKASSYWENHSYFGKASASQSGSLGKESIERILINAVFPFVAFYARKNHLLDLQERFLEMAYGLASEKNKIMGKWNAIGKKAKNAVEAQALIHLYKNYCLNRRCMECQMAYVFLKKTNQNELESAFLLNK